MDAHGSAAAVTLLCSTGRRCTRGILVSYLCWGLEQRTLYRTADQIDAPSQEAGAADLGQSAGAQTQHRARLCGLDERETYLHFLPGYAPDLNPDALV